jgi:hypothetical protein
VLPCKAEFRPLEANVTTPIRIALRELGRRAEFLDGQTCRLDELIIPLVTARAPAGHRLNPGGNREASNALRRIVITRMSNIHAHRLTAATSPGAPDLTSP